MRDILFVAAPLLIHTLIAEMTAVGIFLVTGSPADAALSTAVAAALTIPAAVQMYRKDTLRGYHNGDKRQTEGEPVWKNRGFVLLLCAAAGGGLNLAWSGILQGMKLTEYFSNTVQEQLLAGQAAVQILGLGVLIPIAEELIFRALIYERMKVVLPVRQSILFSALLFSVSHGNMIQILFSFPLALVLAWLYEKGNWLGYPIAFHMGANLTAVFSNLLF